MRSPVEAVAKVFYKKLTQVKFQGTLSSTAHAQPKLEAASNRKFELRKRKIQLLALSLLALAQFAAHSASAECSYNARGARYCGDYGVSQEKSKAREERIKKANRERAAKSQEARQAAAVKKMKEDVQAEKDRLAKSKGEPEVTTQKCYLVNGQLNCK